MSAPTTDSDVLDLADRIAAAISRDETGRCQQLVVSLAARAGWRETRRLVLARAHRHLSGAA